MYYVISKQNVVDPYLCVVEVPNVCPPIVVVQIDSYCVVNKIHATHFWMCMLAFLGGFIECKNRCDFQMGAST